MHVLVTTQANRRRPRRVRPWEFAELARRIRVFQFAVVCLFAAPAWAVERLEILESDGTIRQIVGESLVVARDGGLLLLADDGRIWTLQPEMIKSRVSDDSPLIPIHRDEIARQLLEELPQGFEIYRTSHYVIAHNTQETYVKWVGGLFEQLYRGFFTYWKNQGWELPEPRFPLVALVFADRASFDAYGRRDVGNAADAVIGYYNLDTNRMTTFNVPNAERNVATIIHEATHQLAYNSGLQQRYADNPMWVSEGLAMFFESPDFNSSRGWRSIGRVNSVNLQRFRNYLPRRGGDSLVSLLGDDERFRKSSAAGNAYAEAWALVYFLLRTKRQETIAYLRELSAGKPLRQLGERERIEMFERIFKTDLATLDRQFVSYMQKVN